MTDQQTPEYLQALGNVVNFCGKNVRCKKPDCPKCIAHETEWQRSIEMTDLEFEMAIWGVE